MYRVGSVDRNSVVRSEEDGWMFSGRLLRVRSIQDYDPSYMGYHLNGINSRKRIISAAVGLGMPSINTKILGKHLVLLPANLDEQHNIASALSDIDSLISQLAVLIEKKEAIFKGTMQDLLSGKRRLQVFSGSWKTKLFEEIFTFLPNNTLSREFLCFNDRIKNIHYGDILVKYGSVLDCENSKLPTINSKILNGYRPRKKAINGDVIIADTAEDEMVCKATELFNVGDNDVVAGLHTMWCRPIEGLFAPKFLGYYLNASVFHNQILPLIQGTKVCSVSKSAIKDTSVSFPHRDEQQAIADILFDMEGEIEELKNKREKYVAIRQGMMQQLLTGKIRLI